MNIKHKGCCGDSCCGLCCTKIENFGVTFGKNEILKDVNIHIHCGELTAVIGPNGAGKSTLLKAILGEIKHTGELKFLDAKGVRSGHPLIGYVPQYLTLDNGSPTSVLDLYISCTTRLPAWLMTNSKVRKKATESLARVKADHLLDRRLGALSGGELQRVLLALALDPIPDILLLDEPVSGIDHNGLELFYDTVSQIRDQYDLSIILISHDLDMVAQFADRVILLNNTVLCAGTPEKVFNDERLFKVFGMSWYKQSTQDTAKTKEGEEIQ